MLSLPLFVEGESEAQTGTRPRQWQDQDLFPGLCDNMRENLFFLSFKGFQISQIDNTWKAILCTPPLTSCYRKGVGPQRKEWGAVPTKREQRTWGLPPSGPGPLSCCGGGGPLRHGPEADTNINVPHSGPHRGPGPDGQDDRKFTAQRLQDQEGHVPYSGAAVQRAAGEADDHTTQHHTQLCAVHHPQPREEGEATCLAPQGVRMSSLGISSGGFGKGRGKPG